MDDQSEKDKDLRDIRLEEGRRGRRPIDLEAHRRRSRLLRVFRQALELRDEELFKEAIVNDLGQLPGSPEYQQSLKIWREFYRKPLK